MARKTSREKYRDACVKVSGIDKKRDDAREVMGAAREKYLESEKEELFEEVRHLEWKPPKGGGARTDLFAEITEAPCVHRIRRNLEAEPEDCWGSNSSDSFEVGGITFRYSEGRGRDSITTIRASIRELQTINIKAKSLDRSAKRKMRKMVDASGLTPEQLEKVLAGKQA